MVNLVIGIDGKIGRAVYSELLAQEKPVIGTEKGTLDLLTFNDVPTCKIAYICAARIRKDKDIPVKNEWNINVDGTIKLIKLVIAAGGIPVFLSSIAVETRDDMYARMKTMVEITMHCIGGIILRLGTVRTHNIQDYARWIIKRAEARQPGLFRMEIA